MDSLSNPNPQEANNFLSEAFRLSSVRPVVVLIGNCTVEYSGRAKSFLGPGERVIIIKPDGVVLVHRVGGTDPVNWQPPGTSIHWWHDETLVVEAVHHKQQERMVLEFNSLSMLFAQPLQDGGEFSLVGMEKDIVDSIAENPSIIEEGLVVVKREQATRSGAIDLVCRDKNGIGVILEVKRSSAGPSAANQLVAYITDTRKSNPDSPVRGILVAPKIQPTARTILEIHGLEHKEIDLPRMELKRNQTTMARFM